MRLVRGRRTATSSVTAEIVIADQKIDGEMIPRRSARVSRVSAGFGCTARSSGQPSRLAEEPLAGQTTIVVEEAPQGWAAGDEIVLPDTRQFPDRSGAQANQIERLHVVSVDDTRVTLDAPLKFGHKGARTPDGKLQLLPHVGNITRNIVIRWKTRRARAGTPSSHHAPTSICAT